MQSSPAIGADGTVYVGSEDYKVYALDGTTGTQKWVFTTGGPVQSSPAIGADGTVYVGSDDYKVYSLDGATGSQKWVFTTGGPVQSSPAIGADGTVYVGSGDHKVYALDGATGTQKWVFTTGHSVHSSPAIGADGTVYVGSWDGKIYALDGATGTQEWEFTTSGSVHSSPAIGADGTVYVGSTNGKIYALDGATGTQEWEFTTGSSVHSSPAIGADGAVYVGSTNGKVYALDGATGSQNWVFTTWGSVQSSPAIGADGTVYVGSGDHKVYALDGATGTQKWVFMTDMDVHSSPAIGADGTVYVGSRDYNVYAFGITITVPNVVGMTETDAETALQAAGLSVGLFNSVYSDTVQATYIISQNPPAGTLVAAGSSVALTSSLGPEPATVTVPNVVGMTQADAENYLSSVALLTTGTISQVYSSTVAAGYVISQNPAAGATVATYSAVDLTVSLGPEPSNVTVPDVTNMSQAAAQTTLTSAGLTLGAISQANSSTVPVGYVISQNPAAGASVASGTAVSLTISLGLQVTMVTVPNVVGLAQADAQTVITGAGLTIGTITQAYSDTIPSGNVISQDPAAGASVASGTAVSLTISLGPQVTTITVPNVIGVPQADAQSAITSAGLTVGIITQAYSDTVPSGNVISQDPPSGASVSSGTAVNLTISQGPQTVTVPNVVGMSQADAQNIITSGNLIVGTITQAYSSTVSAGYVISQSPEAGISSILGTAVSLTVSQGPQPVVTGTVPNVVGMTLADAQNAIISAGLTVPEGYIFYLSSSTVPVGCVLGQYPAAGASVASGTAIMINVSTGSETVTIPNVIGMAQSDAQNAITSGNLTVGTITQAYSSTVAVGYVISQSPEAGVSSVGGTAVSLTVSLGPQPVVIGTVPDVVGMTLANAENAITSAGLTVGTVSNLSSSTVPAGCVIAEYPTAGTSVTPGTAIYMSVSTGPEPVTIPNMVGMSQAAAQNAITSGNLIVGTITQAYSNTVPAGNVISQSPQAGVSSVAGTAVNLTVSQGPQPVVQGTVPNVVGMTVADAENAITSAGLTLGTVSNLSSSTVPAGCVIGQYPAAGASVDQGSAIMISVSTGSQPVTIPNVVGMTQANANGALTSAGLVTGTITQVYSSTVSAGYVISQSPEAGVSSALGTAVSLTVSLGPQPVVQGTVPNVVGMTLANAQNAITSAGLTVPSGYIFYLSSSTVPAGYVISQYPSAGASAAPGTAIMINVSTGPQMVTIPNVIGMAQANAQNAITSGNLIVGTITQAYSSTVAVGYVISQSPEAGVSSVAGTAVSLTVSLGPQPVVIGTVPNVVGMTLANAMNAITSAGLTVPSGYIFYLSSSTVPAGCVIGQYPAAGALLTQGAAIFISVSTGP